MAQHRRRLHASAAEPVAYTRGPRVLELDEAIPGDRAFFERLQGQGGRPTSVMMDWLIDPRKLRLDGQEVAPEKGDTIVWSAYPGHWSRWQVLATDGERVADTVGQYPEMLRVHAKLDRVATSREGVL